jgi:hypothetical protein
LGEIGHSAILPETPLCSASLGVVDPKRVAFMGHSYGAFMTANLLVHSDLFRAGSDGAKHPSSADQSRQSFTGSFKSGLTRAQT